MFDSSLFSCSKVCEGLGGVRGLCTGTIMCRRTDLRVCTRSSERISYSRGVLILQETKFISLSIRAERLHDGNDASRGERRSAVKGWTWGGEMGQVPQKEKKTQPQTKWEGNRGSKYEELVKKIRQQTGQWVWRRRRRDCVRVREEGSCQAAVNGHRGSSHMSVLNMKPFIMLSWSVMFSHFCP